MKKFSVMVFSNYFSVRIDLPATFVTILMVVAYLAAYEVRQCWW